MYSGLGRHIERLVAVLSDEASRLQVVTDDQHPAVCRSLARAAGRANAAITVLPAYPSPATLDPEVPGLARLAHSIQGPTTFVLNGWANAFAAEGLSEVRRERPDSRLVFFPHYQTPLSVPMSDGQRSRIMGALGMVAAESDLVVHDSCDESRAWERDVAAGGERAICHLGGWLDLPEEGDAGLRPGAGLGALARHSSRFTVLMVADLNEWYRKGMDLFTLLAARSALVRAAGLPSPRFVVAGTMPRDARLRARCRHLRLMGVRFLGYVSESELRRAYLEADVYLMCSREEAYCIPVVEALSAGCTVVARPIGIAPEVVVHGHNGVLCDSDLPADWWRAISEASRLARSVPGAMIRQSVRDYDEAHARASLAHSLRPLLRIG